MIKIVNVKCQNPMCKNEVSVIANQMYFGILCKKCSKANIITAQPVNEAKVNQDDKNSKC